MKWILSANTNTSMFEFHLLQGDVIKEKLRYDPLQNSARISYKGGQRVVYIEKTGFWNTQTIFKNEYGLEIGRLLIDKWNGQGGLLKIENKRYQYSFDKHQANTLVIYENDSSEPLITCSFTPIKNLNDFSLKNNPMAANEFASLLMGLGWYLMTPAAAEQFEMESASFA